MLIARSEVSVEGSIISGMRFLFAPEFEIREREIQMRLSVLRIELCDLLKSGSGFRVACECEVGAAEIVVGGGELGIEFDGLVVLFDRLLELVLLEATAFCLIHRAARLLHPILHELAKVLLRIAGARLRVRCGGGPNERR